MKRRRVYILIASIVTTMLTDAGEAHPPTGTIATSKQIAQSFHKPDQPLTLVHVWATWCDPCREEFPELLRAYRKTRSEGLVLQLVSADDPKDMKAVNRFLAEQQSPVGTLVASELGQDFIETFSLKWSGALPASFFFDAEGNLLMEWQGKHSYQEYVETIEKLLKPKKE